MPKSKTTHHSTEHDRTALSTPPHSHREGQDQEHNLKTTYLDGVQHRTPVVDGDAIGGQEKHGLKLVKGVCNVVVVLDHDEGNIHRQVH